MASRITVKTLRDRIAKRVGVVLLRVTAEKTKPFSKELAKSYRIKTSFRAGASSIKLRSPFFWAAILDKGREAVRGRPFLIWFQNPLRDDPRLRGLWHRRKQSIPKLSNADFAKWAKRNREHLARGGDRYDQPMIVAREVGPTAATNISKRGNREILRETDKIIEEELQRFLDEIIPETKIDRVRIEL